MFYATDDMTAIFSREAHVRAMLRFEAALAAAEARVGIIPPDAAGAIADGCRSYPIDAETLFREATRAGTLAIPLVKSLTSHVGAEAGAYVHWGATSQDAIDTAFMLQSQQACGLIESRVVGIAESLAGMAETHRSTPMIGRTLTQQALPITLGLKAARWLAMFSRQLERLQRVRVDAHAVQFGGAAGTLASLGDAGPQVMRELAAELKLPVPDLPWHTERDRVVEIASAVAGVAGSVDKVAGDLLLMAQSEIGEISERAEPGKGGSSAMPHKRNPVDLVGASAAARLATESVAGFYTGMQQEHERSPGAWQAEWERIPNLYQYTDYALERLASAFDGLEVHAGRMRGNLDLSGGLIMAESLAMTLARRVGRIEAYRLVDEATRTSIDTGTPLGEICHRVEGIRDILSSDEIDSALDPVSYLGSTDTFIDNALANWRSTRGASGTRQP